MDRPDFSQMTDAEFNAYWEARTEAAALTGDDDAVEAAIIAHSEAYVARFPIGASAA